MYWIMLPVLMIIGYTISVIDKKRSFDIWLMPWTWVANIYKAILYVWMAMMVGYLMPSKAKGSSGDSQFRDLSPTMAREALEYAKAEMIKEGIVYPDAYIPRAFDCENFAQTQKHYVDVYLSRNYAISGKGFPTVVIGYDKDKGGGHAILQMTVDGVNRYFDSYPGTDKFFGYDLSLTEIASIEAVVNG